jgi:glycosyltransferase involved in cell wall biosynthesis
MSCGCAIVSVDRAPMPEFLGESALYYPTAEPLVLAEQISKLINTPAEQEKLRQAARRRAAGFTWEATRDSTIRQLELACS